MSCFHEDGCAEQSASRGAFFIVGDRSFGASWFIHFVDIHSGHAGDQRSIQVCFSFGCLFTVICVLAFSLLLLLHFPPSRSDLRFIRFKPRVLFYNARTRVDSRKFVFGTSADRNQYLATYAELLEQTVLLFNTFTSVNFKMSPSK